MAITVDDIRSIRKKKSYSPDVKSTCMSQYARSFCIPHKCVNPSLKHGFWGALLKGCKSDVRRNLKY